MVRGAFVLAVLAAGLLTATLPAGASTLNGRIDLTDAELAGEQVTLDLGNGASALTFMPRSGGIQIWVQRAQCVSDHQPGTCVPPSTDTRRATLYSGDEPRTLTMAPREGALDAAIQTTRGSFGIDIDSGSLQAISSPSNVHVASIGGAREEFQRFEDLGPVKLSADDGDLAIDGPLALISWNAHLTYTDANGRSGEILTGESWIENGVQWTREIVLARVDMDASVSGPWGDPFFAYMATPFTLSAAAIGVDGAHLTDVDYRVMDADPSTGLTVEPNADAPDAPPAEDDSVSTRNVALGASAMGAALVGAIAYYWPRFSWGLTVLALPMYSRIEKSELLDHGVRENLYEIIQHEPGIHAHALAERAGIGWGTTVYHLRLLERNRMVTSERAGRYRRFFPAAGFLARKREVLSVLQNDTTNSIARLILRKPGMNQKAICEELTISPSLANWHLNRLLEAELCFRERRGRTVHYFPGQAWDEIGREVAG